jgi:hypothetical protein
VRAQPRAAARLGAENSKSSGQRSAAVVPRGRLLKTAEGLQIVKPRLLSAHRGEIQVRKQIIDRLFRELHVTLRFRVTRSSPWFLGNLTWACASFNCRLAKSSHGRRSSNPQQPSEPICHKCGDLEHTQSINLDRPHPRVAVPVSDNSDRHRRDQQHELTKTRF